jgi:hypothetical protein
MNKASKVLSQNFKWERELMPKEALELQEALQIALEEIGPIDPWWSEADQMFVFTEKIYPAVLFQDTNKQKTIDGYVEVLKNWLIDRLNENVSETAEKVTTGHGGRRAGAGRPPKPPTKAVRIDLDVANWLEGQPEHIAKVRSLMKQEVLNL